MADRVNTKFVIGLSVGLLTIAAIFGGLWFVLVYSKADPQKLIQQGDGFMAQGMVEDAIAQYGKAVRKRPEDLDVLLKYVDALQLIQTDEPLAARNYLRQIGGALSQATTQEPRNEVAFERMMQMYMRIGRELGDFAQWNKMYEVAEGKIQSGMDIPLTRKYRGIAQVFRMEGLNLTEEQRLQAHEDLTTAVQAFPEERNPHYYLAAWHMMEAKHLQRRAGSTEAVAEHQQQARALLDTIIEAHPEDPQLHLDKLRILGMRDAAGDEEVTAMVQDVEERLTKDASDVKLILEASQVLPLLDRKPVKPDDHYPTSTISGLRRAERLLRASLEVNPENPHITFALGEVLRRQRRSNDAMLLFQQVFESIAMADAFEALVLDRLKVQSKVRYADMLLETVKRLDDDAKNKVILEVSGLIEEVAAEYGDIGQVSLVQGKLAMLESEWSLALTKLDQANAAFKDTNPEALLLSAQVRAQLGELGAATQRLERLVEIRPDFLPARYDLANNYLRFGELGKAKEQIDRIQTADPTDAWGLYYHGRYLSRHGRIDEAIEKMKAIDGSQIGDAPIRLARLYIAKGMPEFAKSVLNNHFKIHPNDTNALQLLAQLSENADEAKQYIASARDAGVSEKALGLLERQVDGTVNVDELVEEIADDSKSPVGQHLTRYRLLRQLGQQKQAQEELNKAREIDPEHPVIVSVMFGQAMAARQWDEAQALADRAAAKDLDKAQGMFYYGRLELEQNNYDQAINTLRRGLKLRQVYSEGWRLLGDALRQSADLEGAADAYQRAVSQRPNNTSALRGLALLNGVQGNHAEAIVHWRKALQFRPRDRALRGEYLMQEQQHGDRNRALQIRQQTAQIDPNDYANRRALALLLVEVDRGTEALAMINQLIEETDRTRLNIATLAQIHVSLDDISRATSVIKDFVYGLGDEATAIDWLLFARHMNTIGEQDQSHAAYRQAIEIEDTSTRVATREFADLLFDQQKSDESLPYYAVLWENYPTERRVGLRYAEALVRANEIDLAAAVLTKVDEQHDSDATSLILEAMIQRSKKNMDLAREMLNKAAELEPLNPMVFYRRGQLLATEPAMESEVIGDLRRAIELDPSMTAARELLASLHLRRGERNEAVRELESVIKRRPDRASTRLRLAEIYREEDDTVLLRGLLEDSEERFPNSSVWPQLRGQLEYKEGNTSLGIEKLQHAFVLSPSPQLLGDLVQMLIGTDQTERALDMLRQNSRAVSRVPYLQALRGQALMASGAADAAETVFTGAIEQCDEFERMAGVLGVMTDASGEQKTIELLKPMANGSRRGLIELAMAQVEISSHRFQDAGDRLNRIDSTIRGGTDERIVYDRLMAVALQQLDRPAEAYEAYLRVLEERPDDLITLNNTAYLLVDQLDRAQDAVRMAQRAATMAPNNPLVLDTLGWSLYKIGEADRSLQVLRRSVKLSRTPPNTLHLAEVLLHRGDTSDAVRMFTQAKELATEQGDPDVLSMADQRLEELTQ